MPMHGTQICQHSCGSYEFYTLPNPLKQDITFRQARKGFPKAVLVGVVNAVSGTHPGACLHPMVHAK